MTADDQKPVDAIALFNRARKYEALERYDDAIADLQTCLKHKPDFVEAAFRLGNYHAQIYDYKSAQVAFLKAHDLAPDNVDYIMALGKNCVHLDETDMAIDYFCKALDLIPDHAHALNSLGSAYRNQNKIKDAITIYKQAIDAHADNVLALRQLAYLASPDEITLYIEAAEKVWNDKSYAQDSLIQIAFALGMYYEKLDDIKKAMGFFHAGNALKFQTAQPLAQQKFNIIRQIQQNFTKNYYEQFKDVNADHDFAPVFIVGMPRSGTSITEQALSCHKRLFGAGELNLMAATANSVTRPDKTRIPYPAWLPLTHDNVLKQLADYYQSRAPVLPDQTIRIIDKMPINFWFIGLIKLLYPKAKIIHCVRDARDTCLSCYKILFDISQEFSYDLETLGRYYNEYQALMSHWDSILPDGAIHTLHYESFVNDPETELRDALSYCGLEWDPACLEPHKNTRVVRTASATQVQEPINQKSLGRWMRYQDHIEPLIQVLED